MLSAFIIETVLDREGVFSVAGSDYWNTSWVLRTNTLGYPARCVLRRVCLCARYRLNMV